jgi:hypothetical protein
MFHHGLVEEHAVSTEPCDVPVDGLRSDFQISCHLSIGHGSDGLCDDLRVEVRKFLPVGLGESLCAEASFAGLACKPLDTEGRLVSFEVANLFEWP